MFNFVRKTINYSRAHHELRSLQNSKSMLFSSKCLSNNANQNSFTVSYLMKSCGLSLESSLTASKHVHFETPNKPDSVLDFFRKRGFSETQIRNLTKRHPQVLLSSPEKTLLPKIEFFHSIGISSSDLAKMLVICPGLFTRSVENHLIPNFNTLSNLLQSTEKTIALIKFFPFIIFHDVEYYLIPNVKILRDSGVSESNIVKSIYSFPRLFHADTKNFEKNVAVVKEMGINPLTSLFVLAIKAKVGMSKSLWERKLDVYKRWGWSEEECFTAFAKNPWCMISSIDKIMAAMDFFVNQMSWESSFIAKRSKLILLSMEKRVIPRVAVIQFLLSKGLIKGDTTYISTLLLYPEKTFMKRLMKYDEAPQLLKLLKEKLDLSKKTKFSV